MSRLQETTYRNTQAWQWDDGPVFVGPDGRQWAVEYGKAVQRLEELKRFAKVCQEHIVMQERMDALRKLEL